MIWNTPIELDNQHIKNRIVFPPLSTNWADEDGSVNDRVLNFYREIALGGCGMVVVSGTAVAQQAKGSNRTLCLHNKSHLEGFIRLADAIRGNDSLAAIQLMHVGGQGNPEFTGYYPVSPSGIRCEATGFTSAALTHSEIVEIRNQFIDSAHLAYNAGFQAVELHLAHGYLLHEFLSAYSNKRTDEYGGSTFNRVRLILEIIEGIKSKYPGLTIGARISARDYIEDGLSNNSNKLILPVLQESGIAYFSVTAGTYDTSKLKHEAMSQGRFFQYSREIMSMISKPVISTGKIMDIDMAESQLRRKNCDLVGIGRGMVADPMMVKKTLNDAPINYCTECGECQYLKFGKTELNCPVWEEEYA